MTCAKAKVIFFGWNMKQIMTNGIRKRHTRAAPFP
jgi:hypothetical protein